MRISGFRSVLVAALLAAAAMCALAVTIAQQQLRVFMDGDYLRVAVTPHLNFLSGRVLERLKDGASVAFVGQLTVTSSPNSVVADARAIARFALSYDIWEQKFAITKVGERPEFKRTISHLSAEATENWCIENLTIERSLLPPERPFYVQFDLRQDDSRDPYGIVGESGINITQIIDIFRAPAKGGPKPAHIYMGPIRLSDLMRKPA